jgi:serine/threonine protein kinase
MKQTIKNYVINTYASDVKKLLHCWIDKNGVEYKIGKRLAKGSYGQVYELCSKVADCPKILKIQEWDKNAIRELTYVTKYFKEYAPTIYDKFKIVTLDTVWLIIIQKRINSTVDRLLTNKLTNKELNKIFRDITYFVEETENIHGDFHWDNIGYMSRDYRAPVNVLNKKFRFVAIDFGKSSRLNNEYNHREILQLIRTLGPRYQSTYNKYNEHYLLKKLVKYYNTLNSKNLLLDPSKYYDLDEFYAYVDEKYDKYTRMYHNKMSRELSYIDRFKV